MKGKENHIQSTKTITGREKKYKIFLNEFNKLNKPTNIDQIANNLFDFFGTKPDGKTVKKYIVDYIRSGNIITISYNTQCGWESIEVDEVVLNNNSIVRQLLDLKPKNNNSSRTLRVMPYKADLSNEQFEIIGKSLLNNNMLSQKSIKEIEKIFKTSSIKAPKIIEIFQKFFDPTEKESKQSSQEPLNQHIETIKYAYETDKQIEFQYPKLQNGTTSNEKRTFCPYFHGKVENHFYCIGCDPNLEYGLSFRVYRMDKMSKVKIASQTRVTSEIFDKTDVYNNDDLLRKQIYLFLASIAYDITIKINKCYSEKLKKHLNKILGHNKTIFAEKKYGDDCEISFKLLINSKTKKFFKPDTNSSIIFNTKYILIKRHNSTIFEGSYDDFLKNIDKF